MEENYRKSQRIRIMQIPGFKKKKSKNLLAKHFVKNNFTQNVHLKVSSEVQTKSDLIIYNFLSKLMTCRKNLICR